MRYAAALAGAGEGKGPPPVERWNPDYCGELDLVIRRDGLWIHEGTPIGRAPLVRLFSGVLKKEGARYYLVTPVEKLGVTVEDAPFLAVLMEREGEGAAQRLVFTTNVGDKVAAGPGHAIEMRDQKEGPPAPYLHVRRGLDARIARAVFYDLVAIAEQRETAGGVVLGVRSDGAFFPLGAPDAATTKDQG